MTRLFRNGLLSSVNIGGATIVMMTLSSSLSFAGKGNQGASIQGAALQGAALQGAAIQGASIQGAAIQGASIQGAAIQGAAIQGASLQGASLQGASIQGAGIQGASLQGAALQGAALQGAALKGTSPSDFILDGSAWGEDIVGKGSKGIPISGRSYLYQETGLKAVRAPTSMSLDGSELVVSFADGVMARGKNVVGSVFWVPATVNVPIVWYPYYVPATWYTVPVPFVVVEAYVDGTLNAMATPENNRNDGAYRKPIWMYKIGMEVTDANNNARYINYCQDSKTHPEFAYGNWLPATFDSANLFVSNSPSFFCAGGTASKAVRHFGYRPFETYTSATTGQSVSGDSYYRIMVQTAMAYYMHDNVSGTLANTLIDVYDRDGLNQRTPDPDPKDQAFFGTALEASWTDGAKFGAPPGQRGWATLLYRTRYDAGTAANTTVINTIDWKKDVDSEPGGLFAADQLMANNALSPDDATIVTESAVHCPHSPMTEGEPLDWTCNAIAGAVCDDDPSSAGAESYCCSVAWDAACVQLASRWVP